MSASQLRVLFEDNHLLILNKPPGVPTMGVAEDEPSLWRWAKQYIKEKYHKPGNVYLGVVSRLDGPVSGVVVFARTSKAAARLNRQFLERHVQKDYLAIIEGRLTEPSGEWVDWIYKDERAHRMRCASAPETGTQRKATQQAILTYRTVRAVRLGTLVSIQLKTGRKHQIRVQFSDRGCPIVGDRRYGAAQAFSRGIALHARRLRLSHPVGGAAVDITAPLPRSWKLAIEP